jgi:hypothetical protein
MIAIIKKYKLFTIGVAILFIFIILIFVLLIYNVKKNLIESFADLKPTMVKVGISDRNLTVPINSCVVPDINNIGDINYKKVDLNYPPQMNIHTSSCEKYWKDLPREYNNEFVKTEPNLIFADQLKLPKEKQFGNNAYAAGLIDFKKLAEILNDENYSSDDTLKKKINDAKELLINPTNKEPLIFQYQLDFQYEFLNRLTWVNRWQKYNPTIKSEFNYDEIKSSIDNINILNLEFKKRIDLRQQKIMTQNDLLLFGLIPFQILKYKIIYIKYIDENSNKPLYIIEISLFRDMDLYINTFAYKGYINDSGLPSIVDAEYIGRNATDVFLLPEAHDSTLIETEILNKNFTNASEREKDPSAIANLRKIQQEAFKIKNNYACFNLDYDPNGNNEYILPLLSRQECEAMYDRYGKSKTVGIFDAPCKTNEECPFYKKNGNYDNEFGGCKKDGQCELPSNMDKLGFHYFLDGPSRKPLCYNCKGDKLRDISNPDTCCEEQNDRTKYPFLKTPDYVFDDDYLVRKNYFNNLRCKTNGVDELDLNCENV